MERTKDVGEIWWSYKMCNVWNRLVCKLMDNIRKQQMKCLKRRDTDERNTRKKVVKKVFLKLEHGNICSGNKIVSASFNATAYNCIELCCEQLNTNLK